MGDGIDAKTNVRFQPFGDGLELIISERGRGDLASIGLTLQQAIDFTTKLARACDELARRQNKPRIIIPGLDLTGTAVASSKPN